MPLYRLESYQGDTVLSARTVELEDDEAAERELRKDEEEFARGLKVANPEELILRFAAGSIGFRVGREPPEDDPSGDS